MKTYYSLDTVISLTVLSAFIVAPFVECAVCDLTIPYQ